MGKGSKGGNSSSYKQRQRQKQVACIALLALLVGLITMLAVLYLTRFRPRDPQPEVHAVQLLSLYTPGFPSTAISGVNLTLNLQLSVVNPNRAPFFMQDGLSQAGLLYNGAQVGYTLFPALTIPAQATARVSVAVTVAGTTLLPLEVPDTAPYVSQGAINISSSITLVGKVTTLNIFSHHSHVVSKCDINVSLSARGIASYSCQKSFSVDTGGA